VARHNALPPPPGPTHKRPPPPCPRGSEKKSRHIGQIYSRLNDDVASARITRRAPQWRLAHLQQCQLMKGESHQRKATGKTVRIRRSKQKIFSLRLAATTRNPTSSKEKRAAWKNLDGKRCAIHRAADDMRRTWEGTVGLSDTVEIRRPKRQQSGRSTRHRSGNRWPTSSWERTARMRSTTKAAEIFERRGQTEGATRWAIYLIDILVFLLIHYM
jgi:hypothetical protein